MLTIDLWYFECECPNEPSAVVSLVWSQNWEGAMFAAWVIQILLSELLHVPATIETGTATAELNFYDIDSPFDYGNSNNFDGIRTSNEVLDCRDVVQDTDPLDYTPW